MIRQFLELKYDDSDSDKSMKLKAKINGKIHRILEIMYEDPSKRVSINFNTMWLIKI